RARVKKSSSMAVPSGIAMIVVMVVMAVVRMAVIRHRAVAMQHPAVRQVRVVVMMAVDRKAASGAAEQALVIGAAADRLRRAAAADMPVEADHRVGAGHHHVQIVRNKEDTTAGRMPDLPDQVVERRLA